RRVAGRLADAVDGAFDAPGAGRKRGQGVRDREPEVVVAVPRDQRLFTAAGIVDDAAHQLAELIRQAVAGGVGDVDDVRARRDHLLNRLDQVVGVRPSGVLRRVLHVLAQRPRVRDHLRTALQYFIASHAELAVDVHVGD